MSDLDSAYVIALKEEIKQLRLERDEARKLASEWSEKSGAEIARLRDLLTDSFNDRSRAITENEDLRKRNKIAVDNWTLEAQNVKQLEDEAHERRAEIEQLKAYDEKETQERARLLAYVDTLEDETKRLYDLLHEALGYVEPDTGWDYENGGYLYDRIYRAIGEKR